MSEKRHEYRELEILGAALGQDQIDIDDLDDEEREMYISIKKEIEKNKKEGRRYIYDIPYD